MIYFIISHKNLLLSLVERQLAGWQ